MLETVWLTWGRVVYSRIDVDIVRYISLDPRSKRSRLSRVVETG